MAARDKAALLLALADQLDPRELKGVTERQRAIVESERRQATDRDREALQWDLLGAQLETAPKAPLVHLTQELTEAAKRECVVHTADKTETRPVAEVEAAETVQRVCALLGLTRSVQQCVDAVRGARKATGKLAWAPGARLFLGDAATSTQVNAEAKAAQNWFRSQRGER